MISCLISDFLASSRQADVSKERSWLAYTHLETILVMKLQQQFKKKEKKERKKEKERERARRENKKQKKRAKKGFKRKKERG